MVSTQLFTVHKQSNENVASAHNGKIELVNTHAFMEMGGPEKHLHAHTGAEV